MKNCLSEAIKHRTVFIIFYTDDGFMGIFYPHFIWKTYNKYFHYTTSKVISNRIFFDGKIKELNLNMYRKVREFRIFRIK